MRGLESSGKGCSHESQETANSGIIPDSSVLRHISVCVRPCFSKRFSTIDPESLCIIGGIPRHKRLYDGVRDIADCQKGCLSLR
jgi:hypothetical protein